MTTYANIVAHEVFWLGLAGEIDDRGAPTGDIRGHVSTYSNRCAIPAEFCSKVAAAFGISYNEPQRAANEANRPCAYRASQAMPARRGLGAK